MDKESRVFLEDLEERVANLTRPYTVPMVGCPKKEYKVGDEIIAPCGEKYFIVGFTKKDE